MPRVGQAQKGCTRAMSWENRGNRRYYYRRRKVGGRVIAEYVGSGRIGELCAALDGGARAKLEAARMGLRQGMKEQDAIDHPIDELGGAVDALVTAVLIATGHHTHKQQWRRQHVTG